MLTHTHTHTLACIGLAHAPRFIDILSEPHTILFTKVANTAAITNINTTTHTHTRTHATTTSQMYCNVNDVPINLCARGVDGRPYSSSRCSNRLCECVCVCVHAYCPHLHRSPPPHLLDAARPHGCFSLNATAEIACIEWRGRSRGCCGR